MNNLREWPVASVASIIIRGLPENTTEREVKSLLLFTKDLLQSGLRPQSSAEESAKQLSAWATFTSQEAALQAKNALDGKAMGQGFLSVELDKGTMPISAPIGSPPGSRPPIGTRRNTTDGAKYSQYPPGVDFSSPGPLDSASTYTDQLYASPQSPIQYGEPGTLSYMIDPVNTKALINQDNSDIEAAISGNLYLQDPLQNPLPLIANSKPRRATNPQAGMSQFGISAYGMGTPGLALGAAGPLSAPLPSTTIAGSSVVSPMGPPPPNHSNFLYRQNRMLPAVNPSDQNPPCNTLYVGNLPVGTSEDELKALFSRQRGYKRLCFRTKANGPMCFVEFEDIGFATKALTELYGHTLSNSVKGGIRLSFSKNPLGVRSPAPGATGAPIAQQNPSAQPYNQPYTTSSTGFATAQHAPPGLIHPTGQHNMPLYVGR